MPGEAEDVLGHCLVGWARGCWYEIFAKSQLGPQKKDKNSKKKNVAPGGANDHPAIGTWRKEKDFSKKPKKSRRIGHNMHRSHAVGPHLQTLGIRVTTSSVNLSFGSHNNFSLTSYEANIHAGHHPSVRQTPWTLIQDANSRITCQSPRVKILDACILIPNWKLHKLNSCFSGCTTLLINNFYLSTGPAATNPASVQSSTALLDESPQAWRQTGWFFANWFRENAVKTGRLKS